MALGDVDVQSGGSAAAREHYSVLALSVNPHGAAKTQRVLQGYNECCKVPRGHTTSAIRSHNECYKVT